MFRSATVTWMTILLCWAGCSDNPQAKLDQELTSPDAFRTEHGPALPRDVGAEEPRAADTDVSLADSGKPEISDSGADFSDNDYRDYSGDATCVEGVCGPPCFPSCDGKSCGDDGCCGSCGQCPAGLVCKDFPGKCVSPDSCTNNCAGRECGPGVCGGDCGQCPFNWHCQKGICVPACVADCLVPPAELSFKQCGWDGCPGVDGQCMGTGVCGVCPQGFHCVPGWQCVKDPADCSCEGLECGTPSEGCPSCGSCPPGFACDQDAHDNDPFYFQCEPCVSDCLTSGGKLKECGDDGCHESCGHCPDGESCHDAPEFQGTALEGTCAPCIPQCMTPPGFLFPMECGPNSCPPGCMDKGLSPCNQTSDCAMDQQCNAMTGMCVKCNSCGTCPAGWACDVSTLDDPDVYVCGG